MPKGVRITIPHDLVPTVLTGLEYTRHDDDDLVPKDEAEVEEDQRVLDFAVALQEASLRQNNEWYPIAYGGPEVAKKHGLKRS